MKVTPKFGIDKLLFGMKQRDVGDLYGKPDKEFRDDDKNIINVYDLQKCRLTFYADEDFRLGYIISSHAELILFDQTIITKPVEEVKSVLLAKGLKSWEKEEFDITVNHFNEDNWLILQAEFGEVIKVEIGAIINDKDEFDWKFKSK